MPSRTSLGRWVAGVADQFPIGAALNRPLRDAEKTAARAAVEDTAKRLEQLARETARANELNKADELKKLAEQLQRSAEQLRANATNPEDRQKSTLREISALEKMGRDKGK